MRLEAVLPWRIARWLLILSFMAVISVGIALIAHSKQAQECSRSCQKRDAWTKLPTAEIVGVCVGMGVGFCLILEGADLLSAKRRRRYLGPPSDGPTVG